MPNHRISRSAYHHMQHTQWRYSITEARAPALCAPRARHPCSAPPRPPAPPSRLRSHAPIREARLVLFDPSARRGSGQGGTRQGFCRAAKKVKVLRTRRYRPPARRGGNGGTFSPTPQPPVGPPGVCAEMLPGAAYAERDGEPPSCPVLAFE